MSDPGTRLRIATYNIHKCQGFDRRISPARIIAVLQELEADVLCLQEVIDGPDISSVYGQAQQLARAFPLHQARFGANRPLHGGGYGNMTLSRLPVLASRNLDLTAMREPRGALQTDLALAERLTLHLFNVHLGTSFMERRAQAARLLGETMLAQPDLHGSRLVLGDFNEWTRGLTTRLLEARFHTFRPRHALRFPRTFPGMLPLLTLDHCYFEPPLELVETRLWRSRTALIASDHLPLIADFRIAP